MASGGGKRRKASVVVAEAPPAARREPQRGMGVAELERIRVELEMAMACGYAIVPPAAAAPCFVPGVAMAAHHQYVGNGAVQVEYFTHPCYRAQHYCANDDSLTRLLTSNCPATSPHQKNQVDQIQTAHPALGQSASSESSSSPYQLQHHRRAQPPQLGQTRKRVAFMDLGDDDHGVEELDLELKL